MSVDALADTVIETLVILDETAAVTSTDIETVTSTETAIVTPDDTATVTAADTVIEKPTTEEGWEKCVRIRWKDAESIKPLEITWEQFFTMQDYCEYSWFHHTWHPVTVVAFPHKGSIVPISIGLSYAVILHNSPDSTRWTLWSLSIIQARVYAEWHKSKLQFSDVEAQQIVMYHNELVCVDNKTRQVSVYKMPTCREPLYIFTLPKEALGEGSWNPETRWLIKARGRD